MVTYHERNIQWVFFGLFLALFAHPVFASAEPLYGLQPTKQIKLGHLGFQSKWQSQWLQSKDSYLGGYWDASFSRSLYSPPYVSHSSVPASQDVGLAAILRYQRNDGTGFYAEAGTGPQYQAISYDLAGHPQGSRFALNTLAGIGFVWKNGMNLGFKASYSTRGQGFDGNESGSMVGIGLSYRW
jgi:hypothetical protein